MWVGDPGSIVLPRPPLRSSLRCGASAAGTRLARRLANGIPGTVVPAGSLPDNWGGLLLPSFEETSSDPRVYAGSYKTQYDNTDPFRGRPLAEPYGEGPGRRYLLQYPPAAPLSSPELDRVFDLPYARTAHPMYDAAGGVPAVEEVRGV
mgnify:CR=1 FL=1